MKKKTKQKYSSLEYLKQTVTIKLVKRKGEVENNTRRRKDDKEKKRRQQRRERGREKDGERKVMQTR